MAQQDIELDNSSFSFSIESTDMGNPSLLEGLLSPETAATEPEKIEPISKDEPKVAPKKKVTEPKKEEPKKEDKNPLDQLFKAEDEEEEEEDPIEKDEEEEDEPKETNQFQALAKDLFGLGVFSKEENESEDSITTAEQFLERFNHEKKKGANEIVTNFIGQFGEDYQEAFEAIYVKGANPRDYWTTYSNIENLSELDITKESNQEAVMRQVLREQEMEEEDINSEIERLSNNGDLLNVAQRYHKVLVKKEAQKLQELEKAAEQRNFQKSEARKQYVQNVQNVLEQKLKTSEFDGIPINSKLAGEIQDFLLVEKYKTPSGETLTDFDKSILELKKPENHANKVKLALLMKILEKDPGLTTIQKTGVTKKTDVLFQEVARQSTKTAVKSDKTSQKGNSIFSKSL